MLASLRIKNFALIEEAEIELGEGFNVITGETGAGKSILVDAVEIVLGGRASADYIRSGQEKAYVEALFTLLEGSPLIRALEEIGVVPEDGDIVLSREINISGKNNCRVGGRTVPLSLYREIGGLFADIHGQHEQQSLLKEDNHLALLDGFDKGLMEGRREISELHRALGKEEKELDDILANKRMALQQKDLYQFQAKEIASAGIMRGEEEELRGERTLLLNAGKIGALGNDAYNLLYAENGSVLEKLDRARECLKELASYDKNLADLAETAENSYYQLEETAREIGRYRNKTDFDPRRLEEIENRLDLLNRLKKKYGSTIEDVIEYGEQAAAALAGIEDGEAAIERRQARVDALRQEYLAQAKILSKQRRGVASTLAGRVEEELASLGMPGASFRAVFGEDRDGPWGIDSVAFHITTNPGEPPKPLAKVASGGEISRIMLALRTILAGTDIVETIIFDEIDTGIGGRAAQAVAERLYRLGRIKQVFCVTHSPILAGFGHRHYYIEKESLGGRTRTLINLLDRKGRINELGRILGGDNVTEVTLKQAEQMLALVD